MILPFTHFQVAFLSALTDIQPDLCVTAAYGNMLPQVRNQSPAEQFR
jgi:methionyl-tRNA formyltransferase